VPAFGDAPATLNRGLLDGLLRRELGFTGLVMTDALEMRAVTGTVGAEEGAVLAIAAGADALCLGHDLGPDSIQRALVNAARSGTLEEGRLREAASRVSEAAAWAAGAEPDPGSDPNVGALAARRAIDADGAVALSRPPLVVELRPEPSIAAGKAGRGLGESLRARVPATDVVRVDASPADVESLLGGHDGRQVVIAVRDAHRHPWQRAIAESLLSAAADAVLVETGLPYWRPEAAGGYIATHGAGRVNLDAAARSLAGDSRLDSGKA
jgi:beta-N-acetylhexosaminidase